MPEKSATELAQLPARIGDMNEVGGHRVALDKVDERGHPPHGLPVTTCLLNGLKRAQHLKNLQMTLESKPLCNSANLPI